MNEQGNSFGYWLRRRRKALDLTQDALAQRVSCSQAAIKKIEAEERRPSRGLAQRLAEHLAIPAQERAAFLQAARTLQTSDRLPLADVPIAAMTAAAAGDALDHAGDQKSPFVGRHNEYGQFLGLIARLTTGCGHVVLIEGEAGIGKSWLMTEVAAYAQQRALPVLATNCYEIEHAIAYQPVIDLATQACRTAPEERLRQITPTLLAEIAALVPAMTDRLLDLQPLSADYPEARQARLFQALAKLFDALAQGRQLIVMIDDIQWADDASLQFLHFLARQIVNRPVLFACAYRDEELDNNQRLASLLESLRREPHTRHMALARLGPGDTEELLAKLNDPKLSAPHLAARLHDESDGNPFFLWSLMHSLREVNGAASDAASLPLPDTLRDSVRVRLARLPHEDRPLLDLAAVLGRRFDFETLLTLTHSPEEIFLHTMESLVRRRLLREDPEWGFYDFSHDKVREVVYRDIGTARRVLLHRAVAEMLEQHSSSNLHERVARLGEHYERGHVWSKAVHYFGLAADHSQKLFAMRESLQWFDRAVALLQVHSEAATQAQQLALYEQRGAARAQVGQIDGAVADFQRVIDAARALGEHAHARDVLIQLGMAYRRADAYQQAIVCLDEALKASCAMGDERHAADTLYHLGTVAWSNGRNDLAIAYHQQAVDICERLGLTDLVAVQAFHGRGEAYFASAEPAAAIVSFSRSLELARGIDDRSYESENLMMIAWACTGHTGLADYSRALSYFDAALSIARTADLQWHLGPTLIGRANVQVALGKFGEAWVDLNEALPRLETLRLVRYQIMANDAFGCLFLDLNLHGQALQHFERGLKLAHDAGIIYWLPKLRANLVIAQLRLGIPIDRAALQAALQYSQDHSEVWSTLHCLEAFAELALVNGDTEGCVSYADQLLALASRGELRELMGQAHRLRGLAWLAAHVYESARKELTLALTLAEQIGRVRLAWECHRALARVAAALGDGRGQNDRQARARALVDQIAENLRGSGLTSNFGADQ
ncbi:MAG: AAA family ATPase [Rhodoferax sp.]|uniref:AAA family ATPase n=1 Tax=Rhodoferax sp. TaxID=50421 RepID=UPI0013FF4836|nr:AAA family ATPase [Rhodoferax sp.]NDP40221.1 AAA family ATPase [Rhodoferax sp.]